MRVFAFVLVLALLRSSLLGQAASATPIAPRGGSADEQHFPANWHPFKKRLYAQIGSAWYRGTEENKDKIAAGTIRIALTVSADGKITQLRVLSNTSNALFKQISLAAIREAQISSFPPELLTHGEYHDEISFTIYPDDKGPKPTRSPPK